MQLSNACFWGMMLTAAVAALLALRARRQGQPAGADMPFLRALEYGGRSVVAITATTACAGLIVSVVTLTGLGLKISGLIVSLGNGGLLLTVLFAALAVWVLGLAVPVTASYILAYVMIVPALLKVGVYEPAAHMFIFYYAVLADVSPPTALAPMAAAAITGGKPFKTILMAWKYCLPAFLVPFMFTLSPEGSALLLKGDLATIAWTLLTSCVATAALAIAFGGWFIRQANLIERTLMGLAGITLLYADLRFDALGAALLILAGALHWWRVRRAASLISSQEQA